jgi:hypothetical protein
MEEGLNPPLLRDPGLLPVKGEFSEDRLDKFSLQALYGNRIKVVARSVVTEVQKKQVPSHVCWGRAGSW